MKLVYNTVDKHFFTLKSRLAKVDDLTMQWPKEHLLRALGFPVMTRNSLCIFYWRSVEDISLSNVFDLVFLSELDQKGHLVSELLDMPSVGVKSFFHIVNAISSCDLGPKCNDYWKEKYSVFLSAKRVRRKSGTRTNPIPKEHKKIRSEAVSVS